MMMEVPALRLAPKNDRWSSKRQGAGLKPLRNQYKFMARSVQIYGAHNNDGTKARAGHTTSIMM